MSKSISKSKTPAKKVAKKAIKKTATKTVKPAVKKATPAKTTTKKVAVKKATTVVKKVVKPAAKKAVKKTVKKASILKGMDKKIIEFYNRIPDAIKENFQQIITKKNDVLNFGPLKGKTFGTMLKKQEYLDFYRDKFLLASRNAIFVQSVAATFQGGFIGGEDAELPAHDIGVRLAPGDDQE